HRAGETRHRHECRHAVGPSLAYPVSAQGDALNLPPRRSAAVRAPSVAVSPEPSPSGRLEPDIGDEVGDLFARETGSPCANGWDRPGRPPAPRRRTTCRSARRWEPYRWLAAVAARRHGNWSTRSWPTARPWRGPPLRPW